VLGIVCRDAAHGPGFAAGFRAALLAGCLIEVIGYVIAVMTVRNRRAREG
jgi:hypothetical protein